MHRYLPTGNEYICLPDLRDSDAAIESLNVILMQMDGLLEFAGPPGEPLLSCAGAMENAGSWKWRFREDWVPEFVAQGNPGTRGFVLAPPGERFFVYRSPGGSPHRFSFNLGRIFQTANIRHLLPRHDVVVKRFGWGYEEGVMLSLFAGTLVASVSFRFLGRATFQLFDSSGQHELNWEAGERHPAGPFRIEMVSADTPDLVVGVGFSAVGAMSANLEAGRVAVEEWMRRSEVWLSARRVSIPGESALQTLANRNGHFARFFAMGRTLDTDEPISMTSRSYRYYVSSAYWDRDSLLWLYPFLLGNDSAHALELLRYAFGRQLQHTGIHSRYISGRILEYGFELDELVAPLVALGGWIRRYPDQPVWEENLFREGVRDLVTRVRGWRCAADALYRTELMPTDDRIAGGRDVLTYNNALVAHALRACAPVLHSLGGEWGAYAADEPARIAEAVRKHLVRDGRFMWGSDLKGNVEFYDEAAGSLALLPYYGFCREEDPAYRKTLESLYGGEYPYLRRGPFEELGNRHTDLPHPWVLSACNSVLSGVRTEQGLDFLRRAPMDNGIACESVNVDTGLPETGLHFGTCAGFVAHAIVHGSHRRMSRVGL